MYDYDDNVIHEAAQSAASQLREQGFAEVYFCPGDATAYRFVILPPQTPVRSTDRRVWRHNYLVCLATDFGKSYEWTGSTMHSDYCGDKWARSACRATGEVVSRFLTALSPLVERAHL